MKKKIICLVLLLCLIISSMFEIICYASGTDVIFTIENMNVEKGQTGVIVTVNMNCTNSFSSANLTFNYDSSVLEYVPYYDGNNEIDYTQNYGSTLLNQGSPIGTVIINSNVEGTLKVGYMSMASVAGKNGEFLKFKFNVKNTAAVGNSSISINATTLKDGEGNNLTPEYTNGIVSILSSIEMSSSTLNITKGAESQLSVSSTNGTIFDTVTWTSSNSSVASVVANADTKNASITANSVGSSTITATVGGVSATCVVTVTEPEVQYSISISNPSWTFLPPTQIRGLNVTFNPIDQGVGKTITWSSSNTNVATVNSSTGEITAVAEGTTVITATDGNKSNTYTLTVSGILGDIDNDSKITSYDAYRALVLYGDQETNPNEVDQNEVVVLDVERNGSMSSNDAYLILKHSVGLISNF